MALSVGVKRMMPHFDRDAVLEGEKQKGRGSYSLSADSRPIEFNSTFLMSWARQSTPGARIHIRPVHVCR